MNKLDMFLLIPITLGFVFGLYKGFVKEFTSLAAIFLGIYGAKLMSPLVSSFLISKFDFFTKTAQPIAYLLVFIAIIVIMLLLAKMLDKAFDSMSLGGVNKLFGGIFGALKLALIVSVLLNVFDAIDSKFSILSQDAKDNSIGYKPLMKLGPKLWEETKKETKSQNENS